MKHISTLTFAAALLLLARPALAALPAPCGSDDVQFKVKTTKKQPTPAVEDGKAQIVFIESIQGSIFPAPTARLAIDGEWVGANRGPSYMAVSVTPGVHHLCASRQSGVASDKAEVGVETLSVEPGKTYFYEFKITRTEIGSPEMLASGGVPGKYPESEVKNKPTIDTAAFKALDDAEAAKRLKASGLSSFTTK